MLLELIRLRITDTFTSVASGAVIPAFSNLTGGSSPSYFATTGPMHEFHTSIVVRHIKLQELLIALYTGAVACADFAIELGQRTAFELAALSMVGDVTRTAP
jgi:hypothetical protein